MEFLLADIGEGIAEVEIMQWFVEPGDIVHQFDRVCEVQSDKATVEITSRFDGQVQKLGAKVGDMLKVGKPLLFIAPPISNQSSIVEKSKGSSPLDRQQSEQQGLNGSDGGKELVLSNFTGRHKLYTQHDSDNMLHIPSSQQNLSWPSSTSLPLFEATSITTTDAKFIASPAVRKLGKEYNVNLAAIQGTGPQGRLLKSDVMKYITGTSYLSSNTAREDELSTIKRLNESVERKRDFAVTEPTNISSFLSREEDEGTTTVVPIRGYNRLMYQRMTQSLSIPHMTYGEEVRMTNLISVRSQLKSVATAQYNVPNLTFLPFFLKASSLALQLFPILNSRLSNAVEEDLALIYQKRHHIGVAMDTPRGLVVAVVRDCQDKSLIDIARDLHRLQTLGKEGNLSESDVSHATFSISNIGAIGGTYMSPVVIPPTVAIGAMGKIHRIPCIVEDNHNHKEVKIEAVDVMNVSWGADHRVIDGATLARFSNAWKGYVENPTTMMLTLR
jgi:2-oxoisovalerate dehydrogenase E2 component (dihydrolipoyl transacylase)